jgi:molybdenum cofactor cytidylyltransferase
MTAGAGIGPAIAGPAIAGLVLAAGESSRMGRDKALLSYRGRTFLETIVAKLREAEVSRIAVVLGHHADEIGRQVSLPGVQVVTNRDYVRGQTSSLQVGLAALDSRPLRCDGLAFEEALPTGPKPDGQSPDAVLLCLVDHPAFEPSTVRALIDTFVRTAASVIIPTHCGRRGHPVLIARPLFEPLLALPAYEGANSVIRAWHSQTQFVEVADPGILVDVDDPEAYRALI